ncbi:MAG: 3-dehydroquinate synthase, partial [Dehalococcoidia bacterium]|nr:3-dehydroquinate synthase [Dehalococcoidia bacterium]
MANIIITGFSATGKSLVAKEVARRLNWNFIDTDDEIVKLAGKSIDEIFQQDGEGRFRELEREVIRKGCQQRQTVIAIGGGAIVDPQNYKLLAQSGLIICLEAKPETIYQRLFQNATYGCGTEVRPLLATNNPLERIRQLKASRQPYYANVDWTIHTDRLSLSQVAEEVIRAWRLLRSAHHPHLNPLPSRERKLGSQLKANKDVACWVKTATQSYPVFVGYGLLEKLGEKIKEIGLSGVVSIISDETVFSIYGHKVEKVLQDAGFAVNSLVVPPGEETKNINSAIKIYDFLVEQRVERDDMLIALGGGMVGDLAGFVAATFLRGMPWIPLPTSLVAMVDASIGGKVGVNHPQGKNLIGAFYQPSFVLADVHTLNTLPDRELISGWAEVIKYGLTLDKEFFEFLEANADKLIKLEPNAVTQAIIRSAAIKAQIVSEDEKERGRRIILNYGHTIAHGLEAATEYKRFLHGEAVAIGMVGAAKLSQRLGLLSSDIVERQQSLLRKFGLPTRWEGIFGDCFVAKAPRNDRKGCHSEGEKRPKNLLFTPFRASAHQDELREAISEVTKAMELDKKTRAKAIRWVLLTDIGQTTIRSD